MEESIRRFNIVLGIEFKDECRKNYFGYNDSKAVNVNSEILGAQAQHLALNDSGQTHGAIDNMNSNPHPKVAEGSLEYRILAERNSFDMLLYEEQRSLIYSYAKA